MKRTALLLAKPPLSGLTYSVALTRAIAPNFTSALRSTGGTAIRQEVAERQHRGYIASIAQLLGGTDKVVEVSAHASHPDCVFIEDTAVVYGDTALVTRPGHLSRRGEVEAVEAALAQRGMRVVRMDAPATLDGGDVLWTGREFLVGLTARTNAMGAEAVARAFPGIRVSPIPVKDMTRRLRSKERLAASAGHGTGTGALPLHLKSIVTLVGPDTLAIPDSPLGRDVAWFIQDSVADPVARRLAGKGLSFLLLPEAHACNVVYANGRFIMPPSSSIPQSAEILIRYANASGMGKPIEVDTSELALADGALTCCSILLH